MIAAARDGGFLARPASAARELMTATPYPEGAREGRADVRGLRLHYVEMGQGPLVVLLHGFPEFSYSWREQLPALAAAGYRAVAVDQRGYATSDKPPRVADYALAELSADVRALITALGEERAFVVGHDWGGVVAWDFAMSYPEALRGLAVLNLPHPQRMAKGLTTLRQIRKSWYVFAFQLPVVPERAIARDDFAVIRKMMGWALKRRPDAAAEVERYVDAMRAPGAVTGPVNYYRAAIRYAAANMRRWRRIAVPVLVIWGEKDPALGAELAAPSARWVPHARVERLPDANHFVQLDAPDRVNRLLVEYLDGRRAEGA